MMPESAQNTQLNKELRLHVAAVLYFLSRLAITVFVFAVPTLYFTLGVVEVPYVIGGAVLVTALFLGYYVAASGLRCAACNSPVLMDNGNRKHPNAARFPGLNHRARVAWDILFSSSYQCMYCVTRCRCKKSWGGKPKTRRTSSYQAPVRPVAESFPGSIFGDVGDPVTDPDPIFGSAAAAAAATAQAGGTPATSERVVSGTFPAAASAFPNAQTVPVSLVSPATAPTPGPATRSATTATPPPEVVIDSAASAPLFPASRPVSAPVPWSIPVPDSPNPVTEPPMNQPFHDPSATPNPFAPASAGAPAAAKNHPAPSQPFHSEFPYAPVDSPADGPPPWTIPSMPVEKPAAAPSPTPARAVTAPVAVTAPAASAAQTQLLRDVVSVLEEGQRSLASAFESLITKLESQLTALAQVPAPAPVPAPTPAPTPFAPAPPPAAPVIAMAPPPPAPVIPSAPELPELLTQIRNTAAIPAIMRAQGKTTLVPLPVLPPVVPPAPAPVPAPFQAPVEASLPPQPAMPPPAPMVPPMAPPVSAPLPTPYGQAPVPYATPVPPADPAFVPPYTLPPAPAPVPPPPPLAIPAPSADSPPPPPPPAPAPSAPYAAPVPPPPADPAPRRRFARPSTPSPAAAQELNQVLMEAFAPVPPPSVPTPAPAPAPAAPSAPLPQSPSPVHAWHQGNGHPPVPGGNGHFPPPHQHEPAHVPPTARQTSPQPPFVPPAPAPSPFGMSEIPLYAPPGAPQEPAPFTFLNKNEDGHFSPAAPTGDSLDENIMPWMQPVGQPGHTRN